MAGKRPKCWNSYAEPRSHTIRVGCYWPTAKRLLTKRVVRYQKTEWLLLIHKHLRRGHWNKQPMCRSAVSNQQALRKVVSSKAERMSLAASGNGALNDSSAHTPDVPCHGCLWPRGEVPSLGFRMTKADAPSPLRLTQQIWLALLAVLRASVSSVLRWQVLAGPCHSHRTSPQARPLLCLGRPIPPAF
jgi:hypothetical protein